MVQKTTRDTSFNYYSVDNTISSVVSVNATKDYKNVRLLDIDDGVAIQGTKIKEHAANNQTMIDLGFPDAVINTDDIDAGKNYVIYGAPFQVTLNNRQHFNNCGIESTLNNLAMAGKVTMKENLSDQKTVEKDFLNTLWNLGYAADSGEIGVLDEADGGTLPDNYRDIFGYLDISSKAYYFNNKCDATQFSDLKDLGYKISQGYGAVIGVCSDRLWQNQKSETGELRIDHAISITGVVYAEDATPGEDDPQGFYVHDTGAWMTRYISFEEFKYVTLYAEHGFDVNNAGQYENYDAEHYDYSTGYCSTLREIDSDLNPADPPADRKYVGKQPGGIVVTLTSEPIKTDVFNLNANGDGQNNILIGNSGENIINGMGGNDTLYGNSGDDEIRGGSGNDIIIGNNLSNNDKTNLIDEYGVNLPGDLITSNTPEIGDNILYGDAGDDIILGGNGFDLIYGGSGNDFIWAGEGRNAAYGEKGNDTVIGGSVNDRLFGDAGNDLILGYGDDDVISGGDGNDTIFGGRGNDEIETGSGNDIVCIEGSKHGADVIYSKAGKATLKFVDEALGDLTLSEAVDVAEMGFSLSKDNKTKTYNLEISHDSELGSETDGIIFKSICNKNIGGLKELYLENEDEDGVTTYKVTVSKAAKINTKSINKKTENNVLLTTGDKGATITTGNGNDFVTMLETDADSLAYLTETDKITYTGGQDKYDSKERNTYYTVKGFGEDTLLAIADNIKGLTKVNPITEEVIQNIVSTDDRLYLDCDKDNLQFFFDVGLNGQDAFITQNDGFFIFDAESMDVNKFIATADEDDASGLVYMAGFLHSGEDFTYDDNIYGNGRIEKIYYEQGNETEQYDNLTVDITNIANDVAGWLNDNGYNTAFDAFKDWDNLDADAQSTLVACYGYEMPMA